MTAFSNGSWDPGSGLKQRTLRLYQVSFIIITMLPFILPVLSVSASNAQSASGALNNASLLMRSLKIAALSAIFATILGFSTGMSLWNKNSLPYKLRALLIFFILLPPYLFTQGWMALSASPPPGLGFLSAPAGEFWCIFILATAFAPLAALIIGLGHSLMPWPVLESICLSQPPFAAFRIVIFPLLKPFIAASTLIIAMLIMLDGTVPLSLQVPVFATEITSRFLAGSSASSVLLGVWPLLFLMLPMGLAAFKLIKRYSLNDSSAGKTHRCLLPFSSLPAPIKLVLCAGNACFIFLIGLPVTGLIRQAFSRANEGLSLHTDGNAVLWSCGIALLTAIISAVFAVPLGAKLARSRKVFFAILAFLPLFIPASLTGITWATLSTKLHAFFAQMPDGFTIVMAHLARALPYTLLISIFAWKTFSQKSTRESVFFFRTHIRQRLAIELPIFLLCFLVAAVISLRELETSLLTVPPGGQTLPLRVFNLMHYGAGADVCKLSLLLSGLLALASVIIVKRWPK